MGSQNIVMKSKKDVTKTINRRTTKISLILKQRIEFENYRFEILELDDNLISKIKIKKGS